jgi:signal transduction histidine kinase/CheY-like chemotaxis protein
MTDDLRDELRQRTELVDDSGQVGQTELAWVGEGTGDAAVHQASVARLADETMAAAIARALREEKPFTIDLADERTSLVLDSGRSLRLGFALRHVTIFPLRARGRLLGALVLGSSVTRASGPADLALAADLAGRTAIALDNAVLYSGIQDADQRKDEFLAMLAHELRNPLAPIRNALSVLRRLVPQEGVVQRSHDIIDRQVEHLTRMVDDLLDVSRLMEGKIRLERERLELATIIERAVETARPYIEAHDHQLSVEIPPAPLYVDGDSVRLAQVFANLLNNAAKFTPPGGKIVLVAERDGTDVRVRVRDNGGGIPSEVLPHIFDLFTQANRSLARSEGGLGIGLTVVRSLLESHGGSVEARSGGAGKGSEFTVRLPAAADVPQAEPLPATAASPELPHGLRILLVDDNADSSEALETLLLLDGQQVRHASDGATALQIARDFKPQLVLCDLGLPGMDGYEVIRRLWAQSGDEMPVVAAVTGYARDEDRRRTQEAGFDYHLAKPIGPDALRALLATEAQRHSSGSR